MSQDLSYFSGPSTSGAGKGRNKVLSRSGSARQEGSDHPMELPKSCLQLRAASAALLGAVRALLGRLQHGRAGSRGRSGAGWCHLAASSTTQRRLQHWYATYWLHTPTPHSEQPVLHAPASSKHSTPLHPKQSPVPSIPDRSLPQHQAVTEAPGWTQR